MGHRFGLQIRAAASTDAPGLAALMDAGGRPVAASVLAARLERIEAAAGAALVAVEWGPPSGVVVVTWSHRLEADLPFARISLLLVGPDDRRRGIGRLLLKAAAQAARVAGCGTLVVDVAADAATLRAFCDATGFAAAGMSYARSLRKNASLG